jgi:hypothetical protein
MVGNQEFTKGYKSRDCSICVQLSLWTIPSKSWPISEWSILLMIAEAVLYGIDLFLNGIHMKLKSNEIKRFLHHVDGK